MYPDRKIWFDSLPTAGKLLLIISAVMLPVALILVAAANNGIAVADRALVTRADDQSRAEANAIESLVARNALALRIAVNGALQSGSKEPCTTAAKSLSIAPAISSVFSIRGIDGTIICTNGVVHPAHDDLLVAPGDIRLWLDPEHKAVVFRVGVIGGMATAALPDSELRAAALAVSDGQANLSLADEDTEFALITITRADGPGHLIERRRAIGRSQLTVHSISNVPEVRWLDRLLISLPLLMWVVAALLSWFLVSRLLIRPLRRMQKVISAYQPGAEPLVLPDSPKLATEIRALGDAFTRAVERIDESEQAMGRALEGQRRLVREVHHRVKNNLQVVASLLSIHGRSAGTSEARDAYAGIGRRVDALAVVHRNHFAEMEENRGIELRPMLTELASGLRASAPDKARGFDLVLELDSLATTQDNAVATAFLVTEVVEHAMLRRPEQSVEIVLRRTSDLNARLSLSSGALVGKEDDMEPERVQFERIMDGLARQLRSPLERQLGRYSVDIAVFPPR